MDCGFNEFCYLCSTYSRVCYNKALPLDLNLYENEKINRINLGIAVLGYIAIKRPTAAQHYRFYGG